MQRRLYIGSSEVQLTGDGQKITHRPPGLGPVEQARIGRLLAQGTRDQGLGWASTPPEWIVGGLLTRAFLVGPVGSALAAAVEQTVIRGWALELAIEVEQPLAHYPWETLRVPAPPGQEPGRPLVLLPQVKLHRFIASPFSLDDEIAAGPLQVLAVVGPSGTHGRTAEVRRERELETILDITQAARRQGSTMLQVLEDPSVEEMLTTLKRSPCPVVHLACEISRGGVLMGGSGGRDAEVVSFRTVAEHMAGAGVSLAVLAGSPNAETPPGWQDATMLDGAYWFVHSGVIATSFLSPFVPQPYARAFWSSFYLGLATGERTDPLSVFTHVRLMLDAAAYRANRGRVDQLGQPLIPRTWWNASVLVLGNSPHPLYDVSVRFESPQLDRELTLERGRVLRPAAVPRGRCRQRRALIDGLARAAGGGVLLKGSRGIGKSVLAEQVCAELERDGWAVAVVVGLTDPEGLLEAVGDALRRRCRGIASLTAMDEIAQELLQLDLTWQERFELLSDPSLSTLPMILLLDDFEENLGRRSELADPSLAELLTRWLNQEGQHRLLVTCAAPFSLPEDAQSKLSQISLDPLSPARARVLAVGMPGLDLLEPDELRQACALAGGHPRVLTRMSALLRRGRRTFAELSHRLRLDLAERGMVGPEGWWDGHRAEGETSLAVEIAEAAQDVLDQVTWEELERRPLARGLLAGASAYRVPVRELGLTWQVAVEGEPQVGGAPVAPPSGLPAAQSTLEELRLLVRLDLEGEPPKYVVPRWVRPLLLERMSDPERTESHRRAARYWRWQGDADSRTLSLGVEALLEARFHHDAAGELELAVAATTAAGLHHLRGSAWGRLDRLCRETLSWVPPDSLPAARFYHMLGLSAARQGEYASAIEHYQRALDINNRHSVRAVLAASYHQLGLVAEERGEQGEALSWYGKALEVEQEVGDLAGQADTCLRLGWIDRERGDDEAARRWYQRALQVLRDLGDEPLIMATLNHLGQLAGDHGDWTQATAWYGEVLDSRRLWSDGQDMVANFHLLGLAAQDRGDYGEAFLWYRQALDVEDSRGYRPGVAFSYRRLGRIAELCGDLDGALDWYRRSLVVEVEQGLQAHLARTSFRIAVLVSELGKFEEALPLAFRALLLAQSLDQSITVELEMLKHLRRQLGARTFFTLLDPHLDAQNVEDVLNLLDE